MQNMQKITPFLWFDTQAEDAVNFYISLFKDSKILNVAHYPQSAEGVSGKPVGSVMLVEFELNGQRLMALNGGPQFKFTEAVSFMIECEDQAEVDYFWEKLSEGGMTQDCGWLKDKYGLSWQITPRILGESISSPDKEKSNRVMQAMLTMQKIDVQRILDAAENR
jgi:predicted 3-demethylubiquinone-9 3-methyltransferase (glyoxalase superfamily)